MKVPSVRGPGVHTDTPTGVRMAAWLRNAVAVLCWIAVPSVASATSMTLDKVRSYVYAIEVDPNTPNFNSLVANSPFDLFLLGGGIQKTPVNRQAADPTNSKLFLNYIEVTEASSYAEPDLFPNGAKSSIIGAPIPGYTDLYSVHYWDPLWEPEIFKQIDSIAAAGYDGIFLDSLLYTDWVAGNNLGNTPYADAAPALATLVSDIAAYVKSKNLGRPFYLVGNAPEQLAQQYPGVLANLNAVFHEWVYWGQPSSNGLTSVYEGTAGASNVTNLAKTTFKGTLVFGNDYPNPLSDYAAAYQSFALYDAIGWIPSVTKAAQDATVFSTGPFMLTAVPQNSAVTGSKSTVNFLSGGTATAATLIGGDQGDYIIGGPGTNSIKGGAGNDTIYAHPADVAVNNLLDIKVGGEAVNVASPTLTILVNGVVAFGPTAITANWLNQQTQDIQIDTTTFGSVTSIELDENGAAYVSPTEYANIQPQSITFQGQTLSFNVAQYSSGSQALNNGTSALLNQGGKLVFSSPTLPIASPALGNNADAIDGGGGVNTVIYRGPSSYYTVANQSDGSVLVTSSRTTEGPDTLRNIQFVQFTDKTVAINSSTPLRNGAIFSTAQAASESFLRFFNTGTTSGTVTATLSDYATGNLLGQWTSDSIPPGAELQYPIGAVEAGAGISGTKPSYYSLTLNSGITGSFQHVLYRPADGTLTNLSTCATGVTANAAALDGVHSSLLGAGFPSSVVVVNTSATAETVALDVYDARNGNKLGTYTTPSIPAGAEVIADVSAMETAMKLIPSDGMYHYVVKAEVPFTGYLQNLVNNTKVGVITDMTTSCSLNGAASTAATSPLQEGAVFSTAQSISQSFLRFFNTGTSAGTVSMTLKDAATGQALGTWKSPSIPALSEQQFAISTVEAGAGISATKPSYYDISITSGFAGYFQHVLFRPSDGTLTNLSTCPTGVTADPTKLSGVHSSVVGGGAFPSTVAINNTGTVAETVTLDIYDARDGSQLGTYTTAAIPPGGQVLPLMSDIETAANIVPTSSMFHYVLKARSGFTGFMQNLVNNTHVGVITDMTTACAMAVATP